MKTFSLGAMYFLVSFELPWRTLFRFFLLLTFYEFFPISFMFYFKFSSLLV